jgi:hypothetical protein
MMTIALYSSKTKLVALETIEMEFADTDLVKHLQRKIGCFLTEPNAKFCLYQFVVKHRDLKVENVFIVHKFIDGRNEPIMKIDDFDY